MLIHWLPLNGDIKDYGMNAKTWKSAGITYTDGQLGKAAVFDGDASKRIWLESPEENQRLTWTCWVKVNSVGTQQYIISQGRDYQIYGLNIFITSDGRINVYCGSKDNVSYLKSTNLATAGEILHIAVTADENYVTLYINGEKLEEPYLQDGVVTDMKTGKEDTYFTNFTVPENTVFALGDNRTGSTDSRSFGCIPLEKIEGKVLFRFWPLSKFGGVE